MPPIRGGPPCADVLLRENFSVSARHGGSTRYFRVTPRRPSASAERGRQLTVEQSGTELPDTYKTHTRHIPRPDSGPLGTPTRCFNDLHARGRSGMAFAPQSLPISAAIPSPDCIFEIGIGIGFVFVFVWFLFFCDAAEKKKNLRRICDCLCGGDCDLPYRNGDPSA